jgi:hypothetical protein
MKGNIDIRLSSLGYEAGIRILNLILLRNAQAAGGKVGLDPLGPPCVLIALQSSGSQTRAPVDSYPPICAYPSL